MGAIPGLLGLGGGAAGTSFGGPQGAPITNPTSAAQLGTAYTGNQNALSSQQALLNAIQAQNGISNQSQVYNQLQGIANGTGPNPATAQLAQATGANIASQAALNAGARGSSANVGLMARQNAQQGAATQQNAAGQAATLQANQSLNAIGAAGNMANTQASNQITATNANTQAQQAEQAALLNANTAFQGQQVGMQSNINSANAGLANTQMQGQQGLLGGIMNGAGALMGGGGAAAAAAKGGDIKKFDDGGEVSADSSVPNIPAPQFTPDPAAAKLAGSGGSGGGGGGMMSMLPMLAMMAAKGGYIHSYDGGGDIDPSHAGQEISAADAIAGAQNAEPLAPPAAMPASMGVTPAQGPTSSFGKFLKGATSSKSGVSGNSGSQGNSGASALQTGASSLTQGLGNYFNSPSSQSQSGPSPDNAAVDAANADQTPIMPHAKGGMIKGLVSPGEKYLEPKDVEKVKKGANPMKVGKTIPGKPVVGGAVNSYANDNVPKKLKVGGIIVPRSETKSNNPEKASARFVEAVLAKRKKK